ncbi:hypothetical protein [Croceicoccus sp. YJ47]|uniref:hypothetical protein n=1 Tax=Croceicoccus sp. YJ47 TaxID=2798724 RepID=UPI001922153C|nr:hypothetical protein [Croceicoccus sp. YJ47]QQN75024.1 hypothetical protein JD971_04830 [Croceicoccus sp. YJ47]
MTAPHQTFAGVPVRAAEDAMAERHRQIVEFGHTPETDRSEYHRDGRGRTHLARTARTYAHDALDLMQRGPAHHERARQKAVRAAAACLALIDLIDALTEGEHPDAR